MNKRTRLVLLAVFVLAAVAPLQGARESGKGVPRVDSRGVRKGPNDTVRKATYYCVINGKVCNGCDVPHKGPSDPCHGTPAGNPRNRMP